MNRTPEEWAKVSADAVVAGSTAQARNVLHMALQDIASLREERDRIERNRDMWKEQCNRQADQLRGTRSLPSASSGCICQEQHRRGYCREPGCPYSLTSQHLGTENG